MGKEDSPVLVDLKRLNQQQAAALIGVTSRTLRDWPGAPRNPDDTYDGRALVEWVIDKRTNSTGLDLDNERARHAKQQADRLEYDNAVRRNELADLNATAQVWGSLLAAFRARILATPSKLAPTVNPGNPNLARDILERELTSALADLAAVDVRGLPIERAAETSGPAAGPPPAAETEDQRVGRPRAKTKPRK